MILPRVEIISSGTELMRGRGVDLHLGWFGRELENVGLEILHHQTVGDDLRHVIDAIKLAVARSDVVLMTGGLGPTGDDHTREAAARAFHRPLVFRAVQWKKIRERFGHHRIRMAAINRRQAYAPKGARILPNPMGSAPGFLIRENGVLFAAMPGPPVEMHPMFLRSVLPELGVQRSFALWEGRAYGIPEGDLDETVRRIVGRRGLYGLTVRAGQVSIMVRSEGARRKQTLRILARKVRAALGDAFLERDLPEEVAHLLMGRGVTLAVAESCTGGLITHKLTEVPGVSSVLLESVVTYSNASKSARLGVAPELIRLHGAVSAEVARAMADGVARSSGARVGVAVTGIAGPGGGSRKKPVGLCWMAVNGRVEKRVFPGDRSGIKERAANFTLNMIRLGLLRGEVRDAEKTLGRRAR